MCHDGHDAIYGTAQSNFNARNGMGNLVAGMVFFSIGTSQYCRLAPGGTIFSFRRVCRVALVDQGPAQKPACPG